MQFSAWLYLLSLAHLITNFMCYAKLNDDGDDDDDDDDDENSQQKSSRNE